MDKIFAKGKNFIKLSVDTTVYPLTAIYSAGYVFLEKAYLYLDRGGKDKIEVWLYPKAKGSNLEKLGMDFSNELLNFSHYFSSLKTNADALKMLMQRALFSTAPSLAKEAEDKEIEDLIKELEEEEKLESVGKKTPKKAK